MKSKSNEIQKLCSFYVSDWHLVTMLLPYINCQIDANAKIITILENDIEENITTLIQKLNLKNEQKILEIDWKKINTTKYKEIEQKLETQINESAQNIILISGSSNYIEKNNYNIEKYIEKSNTKNIKIINFFEVTQFNNNITQILESHDKIFNTSGEKEIEEVFEGYEKIQNKKVTG